VMFLAQTSAKHPVDETDLMRTDPLLDHPARYL
jgi:hypothetical protein